MQETHKETEAEDPAVGNSIGQLGHIEDLHRTKHKAADVDVDTCRRATVEVTGRRGNLAAIQQKQRKTPDLHNRQSEDKQTDRLLHGKGDSLRKRAGTTKKTHSSPRRKVEALEADYRKRNPASTTDRSPRVGAP